MARPANPGRKALVGLLPLCAVLLASGCVMAPPSRPTGEMVPAHDPLRGGPPIQQTSRPADDAPAQPVSKPATDPVKLGTPTTATPKPPGPTSNSPAALASGSLQPLDPDRSLQIDSPQPAPPTKEGEKGWKGTDAGPSIKASPPPSPLPAPPPPTARSAAPWPPPSFPRSGSRINSYEQAQSILASRRVTWQRLETWGDEGEWKFSCSIPNPQNPNIRRTYEARAAEPIGALRAVVDQIEKEKR